MIHDASLEAQPIRHIGQARCAEVVEVPHRSSSPYRCSVMLGHVERNTPHTAWRGSPRIPEGSRHPLVTWSGDFYTIHEREGS